MADNEVEYIRLGTLIEQAEAVAARIAGLAARIDALAALPPEPGDGDNTHLAATARIYLVLNDLRSQTMAQLQQISLAAGPALREATGYMSRVNDRIEQLPEDLQSTIETKLAEARDEFSNRADQAIEKIEAVYIETRQTITDAMDTNIEHLKEMLGDAHRQVADALHRTEDVVSTAEHDVKRIVANLEKTRDLVLSACRGAGLGARAAAPALQSAAAAFSAVS